MARIFASLASRRRRYSPWSVLRRHQRSSLSGTCSTVPMQYSSERSPYYKLALGSFPNYQKSRPKPRLAVGRYGGLYDYAPHAITNAAAMVGAAPIPYIGYDLTPYYNLDRASPGQQHTWSHQPDLLKFRSAGRELLAGNPQGPQWLQSGLLYCRIGQPSFFHC